MLKLLKEASSTGPDMLPACILKACWRELANPIARLVRLLLRTGTWPLCWRHHWIYPLHKKRAKWDPGNYRGIHLTPQLSKVVERVLAKFFQPRLEARLSYRPRQFAYTSGRGYKDALAHNVLSWILAISRGGRVGLYCSDVSGAFDRVSSARLISKLRCAGVPSAVLPIMASWLDKRTSTVIVDGAQSTSRCLQNSVYQGTVWGPPLWNIFFEDSRHPINAQGFIETVFADDCNAFRGFDGSMDDASIVAELQECQAALHAWGRGNQVVFDSAKEGFYIISPGGHMEQPSRYWGLLSTRNLPWTFVAKRSLDTRTACQPESCV